MKKFKVKPIVFIPQTHGYYLQVYTNEQFGCQLGIRYVQDKDDNKVVTLEAYSWGMVEHTWTVDTIEEAQTIGNEYFVNRYLSQYLVEVKSDD